MEVAKVVGWVLAAGAAMCAVIGFYATTDPTTIFQNLIQAGFPEGVARAISTLPAWFFSVWAVASLALVAVCFLSATPIARIWREHIVPSGGPTITNSPSAPEFKRRRISLADLARLAQRDFGWSFPDHCPDLETAIRHGVNDEQITLEGRLRCSHVPPDLWDHYVFHPMPKQYLESVSFEIPGWFVETANRDITLKPYNGFLPPDEQFCDIHFADMEKALVWLREVAGEFKGASVRAIIERTSRIERDRQRWQSNGEFLARTRNPNDKEN